MARLQVIALVLLLSAGHTLWAGELRGAWIHSPTGIVDKRGWDATVKALADNGYNAIFVNFAWGGCADYPSAVVAPHPSLYDREGNCHDRLQECLDACRKYGVQLHVWVVACNLGDRTPEAVKRQFCEEGRVQLSAAGEESTYLAPQWEENRLLLRDLAAEIVSRYEVDGLHLDYIRYPGSEYDFSPAARVAFERKLGRTVEEWPEDCRKGGRDYEAFLEWRRDNITELVRQVHDTVQTIRPEVQLTAAVYGYWPGARVGIAQDAERWAKEGLVDALCPMNYSEDAWEAGQWLRQQLHAVDGAVSVYSGLANYMTPTPEELIRQIKDTRKCGADGFITFQLKPEFADQWLPVLHETVTASPETPPLRGNEPRPQVTWERPPIELPWRLLRFWRRGDRIRCTVAWRSLAPDGLPERAPEIQVELLCNGEAMEKYDGGATWRKDGTLRLVFIPGLRGYYRWSLRWTDEAGDDHEFRTTSRYVH